MNVKNHDDGKVSSFLLVHRTSRLLKRAEVALASYPGPSRRMACLEHTRMTVLALNGLFLAPVSVIDDPPALDNGDEQLSESSVVASVVLVL